MVRIFNIYFFFEGREHTAIVSVKENSHFTEYTLKLTDDIQKQLPSNIITSTTGNLHFLQFVPMDDTILMRTILAAVTRHLKVDPIAY